MYEWIARITSPSGPMRHVRSFLLHVPRPLVFALVTLAGWTMHLCAHRTRRTILRNMAALLPHTTPRERKRLCRQYIVHECLTIHEQAIEYRRALSEHDSRRARFVLDGREHLDAALKHGRGAIVYTPHIGNYFYSYWLLSRHYDCTTVVTAGSEELRELFVSVYAMGGMKGYDYDSESPRELTFKLRAHLKRNGVVFLLSDFWREEFPDCTLFGKPSKAPGGPMMLALLQKAPIVPCHARREGWFQHRLSLEPPVFLHERYDVSQRGEALQELSRVMEDLIARAPQQWLYWFNVHERWGGHAEAAEAAMAVEG